MSKLYLVDFCKPVWHSPRADRVRPGVSSQACVAQPPSASSAAKAFSSQTCAAQHPSASGAAEIFFELDLCGAAPE